MTNEGFRDLGIEGLKNLWEAAACALGYGEPGMNADFQDVIEEWRIQGLKDWGIAVTAPIAYT